MGPEVGGNKEQENGGLAVFGSVPISLRVRSPVTFIVSSELARGLANWPIVFVFVCACARASPATSHECAQFVLAPEQEILSNEPLCIVQTRALQITTKRRCCGCQVSSQTMIRMLDISEFLTRERSKSQGQLNPSHTLVVRRRRAQRG